MANREVSQHPKPFKKRSHRPWHSDLLEDTLAPLGIAKKEQNVAATAATQETLPPQAPSVAEASASVIPIVSDFMLGSEATAHSSDKPDKGKMLIGGFFKPEALMPGGPHAAAHTAATSKATEARRAATGKKETAAVVEPKNLDNRLSEFAEKLETIVSKEPVLTVAVNEETEQAMVDLSDTEALLESLIKAKQKEVHQLSKKSMEQVKQAEEKTQEAESRRLQEFKERVATEEKMRQVILQIQNYEQARVEEEKRRKNIEQQIVLIVQESETIKKQADERCLNADLELKNQTEARLAAEKLMEDSLEKLSEYEKIVKEAEQAVEEARVRTEFFEEEVHHKNLAEQKCSELVRLLQESKDARQTLEEKYCNLTMEVDAEKKALELRADTLQQEIEDKTQKMRKIVESERALRVILEGKLQKLLKKYLEIEKLKKVETAARLVAERKAKQALEQASKAVMHVLSVSGK